MFKTYNKKPDGFNRSDWAKGLLRCNQTESKMKNLMITAATLGALATTAIAENPYHTTTTGNLPSRCAFENMTPGEMTWNEDESAFTSTSPATVDVKQLRMSSIVVDIDRSIGEFANAITRIEWDGGITMNKADFTEGTVNATGVFTKNASKDTLYIHPATVYVNTENFYPSSNAVYRINWEVTCIE